ncbi:MAG: FKBP-type peptidyl-prolyl cis-trans isomerase [Candidatus Saccharibacteria bacterium]|nr:FKBP-type peptidyl-prolyl cis-trans isomerase [Candidatus Saccharibacteria bacterium]
MEQSYVKTSMKQRIIIFAIAFLLLAATIASYVLIVLNDKNGSTASTTTTRTAEEQAQLDAYTTEYEAKSAEVTARGEELSKDYFDEFKSYRSRVRSYNAATANSNGLKTEDLKQGTGKVLTDGDTDYFAYYIGYCADETVFDSSFDNYENPTSLKAPLYAAVGLIEGWNAGVVGMKLGGVRELTIPGELAYGETQEICGGTNSPLKFVVMAVDDAELLKLNKELDETYNKLLDYYYSTMK